jgi:formylglycine-generating enzyme required for sulfatase activity
VDVLWTAGGLAIILASLGVIIAVFQWLEARRQTKLAIGSSQSFKAEASTRRLRASVFPPQGNTEQFQDFSVFRDIDEHWCPEMVVIPAGKFLMGSPESEEGRFDDERPQHLVKIGRRFAIGKYPVTFEQYDHFCANTKRQKPDDEHWGRGQRPVINVSWEDAQSYLDWLSKKTKQAYRLPTEAEWEYICRAGTTTQYSTGDKIYESDMNYSRSKLPTTDVGSYQANPFKLYDLHGNVWEWCFDGKRTYEDGEVEDPLGPTGHADYRVTRGGAWSVSPRYLRSAFRHSDPPGFRSDDVGFRCLRIIT